MSNPTGLADLLVALGNAEEYTLVDTSEVWEAIRLMTADKTAPLPAWCMDSCRLPNVAPPYPRVFMFNRGTGVSLEASPIDHVPALAMMGTDLTSATPVSMKDGVMPGTSTGESTKWQWPDLPDRTKWIIRIARWHKRGCSSWWWLPVADDGASLGLSACMMAEQPDLTEPELREVFYDAQVAVRVSLFALSLMHCRNVDADDACLPESRQVRRARERRGEPRIEYKVLRITPTGRRAGGASESQSESITAMHLCRGHFKTYTEGAPLFGRITGTYWWADNVRGNPARGVVVKDYEIAS